MKPLFLLLFLSLSSQVLQAQQEGLVIDALNTEPIAGATIVLSDESIQITDTRGTFTYTSDNLPIQISHVGYQGIPRIMLP